MSELNTILCGSLKFMVYKVSSSSKEKLLNYILNDEKGTKCDDKNQKISKQNWTSGNGGDFVDILHEYVLNDLIESIFELSNLRLSLDNAWYQVYEDEDDYHHFHLHENVFISSVLYLELDDKKLVTEFIDPKNDEIIQPSVDEGEGILFGPQIFHRSTYHPKNKRKTIISFNLNL